MMTPVIPPDGTANEAVRVVRLVETVPAARKQGLELAAAHLERVAETKQINGRDRLGSMFAEQFAHDLKAEAVRIRAINVTNAAVLIDEEMDTLQTQLANATMQITVLKEILEYISTANTMWDVRQAAKRALLVKK